MLPDAFGCAVANRFGNLLDDEADPLDLINEVESLKEKKKRKQEEDKKKQQQQQQKKKPGHKESQRDRRTLQDGGLPDLVPVRKQKPVLAPVAESKDDGQEVQRDTRRPAGSAGQRRTNEDKPSLDMSAPKSSYNDDAEFRGRGGGSGGRGRRGTRGGAGAGFARNADIFNFRGKREYDRHTGTGIFPEEKRGGRGPWNWGCVDDAASEMEVTTDAHKKPEAQILAEEDNLNVATEEDKEMVVQVAMEMSLDEWKALQEENRPKVEFNIRKAVDKIPSKAKVIHQSKHPEGLQETMVDEGNFLRRSVNDITSLLDINFGSLGRPSRGGRGRGARGGQICSVRPRSVLEQEDGLAPNPDDPEDFPALSAGN